MLSGGDSSAHLEFDQPAHVGHYLFSDGSCTLNSQGQGPADPINVVFWDTGGEVYSANVMQWVWGVAGFNHGGGHTKWFRDHSVCYEMFGQNATGYEWETRYHARYHDAVGPWVLAPTHYEEVEWCDWFWHHAVPDEEDFYGWPYYYNYPWTGFLEAREALAMWFSQQPQQFSLTWAWWGNTGIRRQCDNGEPWSDGVVLYIDVPSAGGGGGGLGGGGGCGRASPCL